MQRQTQTLPKKRSECDTVKASMPANPKKPTTRVICLTPDPAYFRPLLVNNALPPPRGPDTEPLGYWQFLYICYGCMMADLYILLLLSL